MSDKDETEISDLADRLEVANRIECEFAVYVGIDDERPVEPEQQRVTIGFRFRHMLSADIAIRPGLVFDDNLLRQSARQLFRDDSSRRV